MVRWRRGLSPAALAAAAVLVLAGAPSAVGADALEPVVEDLDGPRGLAVGPHGQVVFSEADGVVSRLATRGKRAGSVRELFSVPAGFLAPAVDARRQRVFALTTAGEPGTGAGTLYRWGPHRGARPIADISGYQQRDPDPYDLEDFPEDSNPYGVAALPRGGALVADAAGNDLLRVSPRGKIRTVARVKPMVVEVPEGLPDESPEGEPLPPAGTPIPAEAVTTSVVVGADGYWYVGELRGFPATPGTSHVWRIKPGSTDAVCNPKRPHRGDCRLYAGGFTSIVDLAAAPDGSIYVAELVKRSWLQWELGAEPIGGVFRIPPGGGDAVELAADQLPLPGGVEAGRNGKVYVAGPIFGPGSIARLQWRG